MRETASHIRKQSTPGSSRNGKFDPIAAAIAQQRRADPTPPPKAVATLLNRHKGQTGSAAASVSGDHSMILAASPEEAESFRSSSPFSAYSLHARSGNASVVMSAHAADSRSRERTQHLYEVHAHDGGGGSSRAATAASEAGRAQSSNQTSPSRSGSPSRSMGPATVSPNHRSPASGGMVAGPSIHLLDSPSSASAAAAAVAQVASAMRGNGGTGSSALKARAYPAIPSMSSPGRGGNAASSTGPNASSNAGSSNGVNGIGSPSASGSSSEINVVNMMSEIRRGYTSAARKEVNHAETVIMQLTASMLEKSQLLSQHEQELNRLRALQCRTASDTSKVAELEGKLKNSVSAAQQRIAELDRLRVDAEQRAADLDAQLRELREQHASAQLTHRRELLASTTGLQAQVTALSSLLHAVQAGTPTAAGNFHHLDSATSGFGAALALLNDNAAGYNLRTGEWSGRASPVADDRDARSIRDEHGDVSQSQGNQSEHDGGEGDAGFMSPLQWSSSPPDRSEYSLAAMRTPPSSVPQSRQSPARPTSRTSQLPAPSTGIVTSSIGPASSTLFGAAPLTFAAGAMAPIPEAAEPSEATLNQSATSLLVSPTDSESAMTPSLSQPIAPGALSPTATSTAPQPTLFGRLFRGGSTAGASVAAAEHMAPAPVAGGDAPVVSAVADAAGIAALEALVGELRASIAAMQTKLDAAEAEVAAERREKQQSQMERDALNATVGALKMAVTDDEAARKTEVNLLQSKFLAEIEAREVAVQESQRLSMEIARLQQRFERLQNENGSVAAAEKRAQSLGQQLLAAQEASEAQARALASAGAENERLMAQNDALRRQLADSESASSTSAHERQVKLTSMTSELERARKETAVTRSVMEASRSSSDATIAKLTSECDQLRSDLRAATSASEQAANSLRAQLQQSESSRTKLERQVSSLTIEVETLRGEAASSSKTISSLTASTSGREQALMQRVQSLVAELSSTRSEINASREQAASLTAATTEAELAATTYSDRVRTLEREVAFQQQQCEHLRTQLSQSQAAARDADTDLRSQIASLNTSLDAVKLELQAATGAHDASKTEHQASISKLTAQRDQLRVELSAANAAQAAAELMSNKYSSRVAVLEKESAQYQLTCEQFREQVTRLQTSASEVESHRLDEMSQLIVRLQKAETEAAAAASDAAAVRATLASSGSECEALKSALAAAKREREAAEGMANKYSAHVSDLEKEKLVGQSERDQLQSALEQQIEKFDKLKQVQAVVIAHRETQYNELKTAFETAQHQLEKATADALAANSAADPEDALHDLQIERDGLQADLNEAHSDLNDAEAAAAAAESKAADLDAQLAKASAQLVELQRRYEEQSTDAMEVARAYTRASQSSADRIQELETRVAAISAQLLASHESVSQAEEAASVATAERDVLRVTISSLKAAIADEDATHKELEAQNSHLKLQLNEAESRSQAEIASLTASLEKTRRELEKAELRESKLPKDAKALRKKVDELQKEVQIVTDIATKATSRMGQVESERDALMSMVETLREGRLAVPSPRSSAGASMHTSMASPTATGAWSRVTE